MYIFGDIYGALIMEPFKMNKPIHTELVTFLTDNGTPRHEIPDLAKTVRRIIHRR